MAFLRPAVAAMLFAASLTAALAQAPVYPNQKSGVHVAKDFKFHTGETLASVNLAYTTLGDPANPPVLILHGTGGSAQSMLGPGFAR